MANVIQLSSLEDPEVRKARKAALVMLVLREDWAALFEAADLAERQQTMQLPESEQLEDWASVRQAMDDEIGHG